MILVRELRTALPLYAGTAAVYASGFALNAALLAGPFRDAPEKMAQLGLVSEALQWVTLTALVGMPAAVLRIVPKDRDAAVAAVATARTVVAAVSAVALAALFLVPGARQFVLGESDAAAAFAIYAFRAPLLAQLAVSAASLHARGELSRKALLEGSERVLVLALGFAGALTGGLRGFAVGSVTATGVVAAASFLLARSAGPASPRAPLGPLLRIGAPQLALSFFEALRPFAILRIATMTIGDAATGHLATAMAFSLPLIVLPELLAQSLLPRMAGPAGEGSHVESEKRRFAREAAVAGAVLLAAYGAVAAWLLPQIGTGRHGAAVAPLLALLPGVLAHGVTAHAGYVLLVRDRLPAAACASAATLAAGAWLAKELMSRPGPYGGAVGGALALTLALMLRAALLLLLARKP